MPRTLSCLAVFTAAAVLLPPIASAATARDLAARMRIDGFATEWTDDEAMFGFNPTANALEEAVDDSKWGVSNDLNQIRITWDKDFLYLAGEGVIWNNNMILFIDAAPGRGLSSMTALNSWRRNFAFDTSGTDGFKPELFGATWDGNAAPRLISQLSGNQVDDALPGDYFGSAATFLQGNTDRAMELAIPWSSVLGAVAGFGTNDTTIFRDGSPVDLHRLPPGTRLKLCGVVTAGGDGTGGPDSAPDNLRGHTDIAADPVFLDNWAIVDLDRNDDTGLGLGGPDGVPDWDIEPRSRITFRYRPPVVSLRFGLRDVAFDRPAFRPDLGERIRFSVDLQPPLDPTDPIDQQRNVELTANVFDLRGRFVRNIYVSQSRPALTVNDPEHDVWDGRDERGQLVSPGVYVLRTVIEPGLSRATRAFVVVR